MKRTVLLVALCMMIGFLFSGNCFAQEDAAAFYKGKTITVLIPTGPGGGFDLVSRAIAPYLEKYTGAKTLMQNGKTILSQNKLYRSKPDGLTVILSGHGAKEITAELFQLKGASFKWQEFTLLGRLPKSSTIFVIDKSKGFTKPSDLQGIKFFHGASSPFFGPLFAEACGWDGMQVIPGMKSGDRAMGMRRGELLSTVAGAGHVAKNPDLMLPLIVTNKDPKFPDVPAVTEVAVKGKEKWAEWAAAWDGVIYWSYATPGIPQDRAAFLEKALEKTYNDPGFGADMKKLKFELSDHFVGAKELQQLSSGLAKLTDDEIKDMKYVITEKYQKK
jgi:tripartite-type tricarboxylate transporter receptor subunit TctC